MHISKKKICIIFLNKFQEKSQRLGKFGAPPPPPPPPPPVQIGLMLLYHLPQDMICYVNVRTDLSVRYRVFIWCNTGAVGVTPVLTTYSILGRRRKKKNMVTSSLLLIINSTKLYTIHVTLFTITIDYFYEFGLKLL